MKAAMKAPSLRMRTTLEDALAIRAVSLGQADEHQQRKAFEAIFLRMCDARRDTFVPGHPEIGDYFRGRASVGMEMEQYAIRDTKLLKEWFEQREKGKDNVA